MGQIIRKQDWAERLFEFLTEKHQFDWAEFNCALFAAEAVKVQTGIDFAEAYRGPKTKRGMLSKLRKICGGDVVDAAKKAWGHPINVRLANRGDVVAAIFNGENTLGICMGSSSVFISEFDGLIYIPTGKCIEAWKI